MRLRWPDRSYKGYRLPAFAAVGLLILALPRAIRILYPEIWLESEAYLNCAFYISRGLQPYKDFPFPHLPVLEELFAVLYLIFPVSARIGEFITQLTVLVSAVLIFRIGSVLKDHLCGGAAALIYSFSYVIFRYHVFEREIYTVFIALVITGWLIRQPSMDKKTATLIAILLVFALSIKLTAIAFLSGCCAFLLIRKEYPVVFRIVVIATSLFLLMVVGLYAVYGNDFLIQAFLFRFVHAKLLFTHKLSSLREMLDINLALAIPGAMLIWWQRENRDWLAVIFQFLFTFIVAVILNPTFWPHNAIELLPWLSLMGGFFVSALGGMARVTPKTAKGIGRFLFAILLFVFLVLFVFPVTISDWGFAYRDREEVREVSRFVANQTDPQDLVFAPPIIALEAERIEIVRYPEIAGAIIELEGEVRKHGFIKTLQTFKGGRPFAANLVISRRFWLRGLATTVHNSKLKIFINPSPADRGYLGPVLPESFLQQQRYVIGFQTAHYKVWVPSKTASRN